MTGAGRRGRLRRPDALVGEHGHLLRGSFWLLASVAVNAFFFVMFEVWFKVPLYKGTLEPLHFLGY